MLEVPRKVQPFPPVGWSLRHPPGTGDFSPRNLRSQTKSKEILDTNPVTLELNGGLLE